MTQMTEASGTCSQHALIRQMPDDTLWTTADRWEQISPDPFSGPDWFRAWRTHFGPSGGRWLPSAVFRGQELVAVAPWLESHETRMGVRLRQITFADCVYSPVSQIISDGSQKSPPSHDALLDEVTVRKWDMIRLRNVPEEGGMAETFRRFFRQRDIPFLEKGSEPNWYQQIGGTAEEYFADLPGKMKRHIRARERGLARVGAVSMRIVTERDDVDAAMDSYYAVYGASWKKTEGVPDFHRDVAKTAAQRGWLRLAMCLVDDVPIAAQLWLVRRRIGYSVKVCYDENYRQYGPGVMLTAFLIRHLIEKDDVREIDFLKGDEEYKANWAGQRRVRRQFVAFNPSTLRGRLGNFMAGRVKRLFRRGKEAES